MAFLDALKNIFGGEKGEVSSEKVYIVDAGSIDGGKKNQMSPHQQISVLKRLASFAKKEKISMQALLDGKPLRVVPDGGDFSGVQVFFTREKYDINTLIKKRLKMVRSSEVIVITDGGEAGGEIESAGAKLMSASTFRKALGGGEPSGGRKSNRRGSGRSRSRRGGSGRSKSQSGGERQPKKRDDKQHVSELIDLVD